MERKNKEILFGAAIIISFIVIFIPYILNGQLRLTADAPNIPTAPIWPDKQKFIPEPQKMTDFKAQDKPREGKTAPQQGKAWVVSVGIYSTRAEAEKTLKLLKNKQLPAYLKIETTPSNTEYWVLVGPKIHKNEAIDIVKLLNKDGIQSELNIYHPNMAFD